ncbi:hypothetical protein [Pseudonocardia spinosispora]|uniref:hypothetical protein n=1 Tax=Pseudonocardia spinosispora TaxID=103441 RepID=UPI000424CF7F|nr:hypothetical protein [Pseudonocardia spinosispora]
MGNDSAFVLLWMDFIGEPGPETEPDALVVRVPGGVGPGWPRELWSELEGALEQAAGRLVVADLTWVVGLTGRAVRVLVLVAEAAARRHVAFCAIAPLHSP